MKSKVLKEWHQLLMLTAACCTIPVIISTVLTDESIPKKEYLAKTSGMIENYEETVIKGRLASIHFSLSGSDKRFLYSSRKYNRKVSESLKSGINKNITVLVDVHEDHGRILPSYGFGDSYSVYEIVNGNVLVVSYEETSSSQRALNLSNNRGEAAFSVLFVFFSVASLVVYVIDRWRAGSVK